MKRVLIVAYNFPPEPFPGAQRPGYLARYLPEYGWEVTVLTQSGAQPPFPARVVHVGNRSVASAASTSLRRIPSGSRVRALLRAIKGLVLFPDETAPWIPGAIARGLQLLRSEQYDAILTTALPSSVHVIGAVLAMLTGTPWIADYRDAWSENPYFKRGRVLGALHRFVERALAGRAAQLTTISNPLAAHLQRIHHREVRVIENGFDSAEWDGIPPGSPEAFDLVYTGTMYGGKRSAAVLFAALQALRRQGHPLAGATRVHFYGQNNEIVLREARNFGVEDLVHVHGTVSRAQAMLEQRRAAGLLIFLSNDPSTVNERGSKYLEYAGAHRPMLVFGPQASALREVVERAGLGWFAADCEAAKIALTSLYKRYTGGVIQMVPKAEVLPTAQMLARAFADRLDRISAPRILMIVTGFPSASDRGTGIFNLRAAQSLARHAHVTVLHLRSWIPFRPPARRERVADGLDVWRIAVPHVPALERSAVAIYERCAWPIVKRLVRQSGIIYSVGLSFSALVGADWARRANIPHVTQVTSEIELDGSRLRPNANELRFIHGAACNSEALLTQLRRLYPAISNARTVYRGVDFERFANVQAAVAKGGVRFLFLGGFPEYRDLPYAANTKGGETLLAAWKSAEARLVNAGASLIIGGPRSTDKFVQQWRAQLRHPDRVQLAGMLDPDHVAQQMSSCDAVLVPSLQEGFPNVALEAAACSRAVIASRLDGIAELVLDGQTGVLLPPGDAGALEDALVRCAEHPEELAALGKNGRLRAEASFDARAFPANIMKLFEAAMQPPVQDCLGARVAERGTA
jgi:glycosyltransferase involved in cell wall biosynthesis